MTVVDPFVSLSDWSSSLYRGEPVVVDRFLDQIDQTLPSGWVRDLEYERRRSRPDRVRGYKFDSEADAAVRLWLERTTKTRVRGGPIEALRPVSPGDGGWFTRLVAEFAGGCVLPAADADGVRHTRPAFGPRSAITHAVEMMFIQLADTADGEWPLTDRAQGLWDELISFGLAEQVGIDRGELRQWLADSGWEPEAAMALTDRLFADSGRLARRLAALVP